MSTQMINDAGEIIAVAFSGGATRGPMARVSMPRTVADAVATMPIFEETMPEKRTTLSAWVAEMENAGRTVKFSGEHG